MLHKFVGVAAILAILAGAALAEKADKGSKGRTVGGVVKKVDPSASLRARSASCVGSRS